MLPFNSWVNWSNVSKFLAHKNRNSVLYEGSQPSGRALAGNQKALDLILNYMPRCYSR